MNGIQEDQNSQKPAQNAKALTGTNQDERKKKCSKCGKVKELSKFYNKKSAQDGLSYYCKPCNSEYGKKQRLLKLPERKAQDKKYYSANKQKIAERDKIYREKNKPKRSAQYKIWSGKNTEHRKEYSLKYQEENKAKIKAQRSGYYLKNREKILLESSNTRNKNPDKIKSQKRAYSKNNRVKINSYCAEKRLSDIQFKIADNLRGRLKNALKRYDAKKKGKTKELIGCSVKYVISHIEKQFQPGMTWENHGVHGWHIDHIKPVASFDLTDKKQQKACFNYKNLQPLWAKDNLKKGAKWDRNREGTAHQE